MDFKLSQCVAVAGNSVLEPHVSEICRWVSESDDLPLISSETGSELRPEVLAEWLARAREVFAVAHRGNVIGFGALSEVQAPLPPGGVEAVHTIVHPLFRRNGVGTWLTELRVRYARDAGYTRVFFRVVPSNSPRIRLLTKLGVAPAAAPLIAGFNWYEHPLSTELRRSAPAVA